MSPRRIGKGWGKASSHQRLERKNRDVANIQQKKLAGSDTITGKKNAEHQRQQDSSGTGSAQHWRIAPTWGWYFQLGT